MSDIDTVPHWDTVLEWVEQDREAIVDLCSELIRCQTPSPPGDTRDAMAVVQRFLADRQLHFEDVSIDETMPNLISSTVMAGHGRHLMFNGHLDVLPAGGETGWDADPWSGHQANNRIWGRGAADMKAGVTAILFAYTYLTRLSADLGGTVSLTVVSDEETGYGRGTGYMFGNIEEQMVADCVLSAEPSGPESINYSSKGYLHFAVHVQTRGAIAGYPNMSGNAIAIAAEVIRDLNALEDITVDVPATITDTLNDPDTKHRVTQLLGDGTADVIPRITVSVGAIQGGDSAAVIAPDCSFEGSVVMPVGTDTSVVIDTARQIVAQHPKATFELHGLDEADYSDPDTEMVTLLQETVEHLDRPRPLPLPDIALSDCRYWRSRGILAYWYGPTGDTCSAANEFVDIDELLHIVRTHTLTAVKYLAQTNRDAAQM